MQHSVHSQISIRIHLSVTTPAIKINTRYTLNATLLSVHRVLLQLANDHLLDLYSSKVLEESGHEDKDILGKVGS